MINPKRRKQEVREDREKMKIELMKNLNERLIRSNIIGTVPAANDPIDCFLNSLGADLRQLNKMERLLAIHEMRQVMYKYQFASLQ